MSSVPTIFSMIVASCVSLWLTDDHAPLYILTSIPVSACWKHEKWCWSSLHTQFSSRDMIFYFCIQWQRFSEHQQTNKQQQLTILIFLWPKLRKCVNAVHIKQRERERNTHTPHTHTPLQICIYLTNVHLGET